MVGFSSFHKNGGTIFKTWEEGGIWEGMCDEIEELVSNINGMKSLN